MFDINKNYIIRCTNQPILDAVLTYLGKECGYHDNNPNKIKWVNSTDGKNPQGYEFNGKTRYINLWDNPEHSWCFGISNDNYNQAIVLSLENDFPVIQEIAQYIKNWTAKKRIFIGEYEVTKIQKDSCFVGCTKVTREKINEILAEMDKGS